MPLDAAGAATGIARMLGEPLGLSVEEAAVGVFRVLLARTVGAVRRITVERGRDPRTFSLLAFGGAGPLLAPLLARELAIAEVIVPVAPAAFSAWGMLSAEVVDDYSRTELRRLDDLDGEAVEEFYEALEREARRSLAAQAVPADGVVLERRLALRYEGQEHSLPLALEDAFEPARVRAAFEEEHERRYGHVMDAPVQVLAVRVRASALPPHVRLARLDGAGNALVGNRRAWCFARGNTTDFVVYDRDRLRAGAAFTGPAIVDEGTSTTVVMSDQSVRVDDHGQLVVTREERT
jgi:N-methylhydantoinase A